MTLCYLPKKEAGALCPSVLKLLLNPSSKPHGDDEHVNKASS